MCLSGIKDLMRVGRKWKMINIQVTLRLRKLIKTFRKSVKLFTKINVWVREWLQTWWILTERQCDKPCGRSGRISGRTTSGRCIRTMPQITTPFCTRSFFPINAFEYLKILHIRGFSTLWLSSVHQSERCTKGNPFSISWRVEDYWTVWGLMSYSTALNNGGMNAAVCR